MQLLFSYHQTYSIYTYLQRNTVIMESGPKAGQEVKVGAVLLMTTHKTVTEKLLLLQLLNVSS